MSALAEHNTNVPAAPAGKALTSAQRILQEEQRRLLERKAERAARRSGSAASGATTAANVVKPQALNPPPSTSTSASASSSLPTATTAQYSSAGTRTFREGSVPSAQIVGGAAGGVDLYFASPVDEASPQDGQDRVEHQGSTGLAAGHIDDSRGTLLDTTAPTTPTSPVEAALGGADDLFAPFDDSYEFTETAAPARLQPPARVPSPAMGRGRVTGGGDGVNGEGFSPALSPMSYAPRLSEPAFGLGVGGGIATPAASARLVNADSTNRRRDIATPCQVLGTPTVAPAAAAQSHRRSDLEDELLRMRREAEAAEARAAQATRQAEAEAAAAAEETARRAREEALHREAEAARAQALRREQEAQQEREALQKERDALAKRKADAEAAERAAVAAREAAAEDARRRAEEAAAAEEAKAAQKMREEMEALAKRKADAEAAEARAKAAAQAAEKARAEEELRLKIRREVEAAASLKTPLQHTTGFGAASVAPTATTHVHINSNPQQQAPAQSAMPNPLGQLTPGQLTAMMPPGLSAAKTTPASTLSGPMSTTTPPADATTATATPPDSNTVDAATTAAEALRALLKTEGAAHANTTAKKSAKASAAMTPKSRREAKRQRMFGALLRKQSEVERLEKERDEELQLAEDKRAARKLYRDLQRRKAIAEGRDPPIFSDDENGHDDANDEDSSCSTDLAFESDRESYEDGECEEDEDAYDCRPGESWSPGHTNKSKSKKAAVVKRNGGKSKAVVDSDSDSEEAANFTSLDRRTGTASWGNHAAASGPAGGFTFQSAFGQPSAFGQQQAGVSASASAFAPQVFNNAPAGAAMPAQPLQQPTGAAAAAVSTVNVDAAIAALTKPRSIDELKAAFAAKFPTRPLESQNFHLKAAKEKADYDAKVQKIRDDAAAAPSVSVAAPTTTTTVSAASASAVPPPKAPQTFDEMLANHEALGNTATELWKQRMKAKADAMKKKYDEDLAKHNAANPASTAAATAPAAAGVASLPAVSAAGQPQAFGAAAPSPFAGASAFGKPVAPASAFGATATQPQQQQAVSSAFGAVPTTAAFQPRPSAFGQPQQVVGAAAGSVATTAAAAPPVVAAAAAAGKEEELVCEIRVGKPPGAKPTAGPPAASASKMPPGLASRLGQRSGQPTPATSRDSSTASAGPARSALPPRSLRTASPTVTAPTPGNRGGYNWDVNDKTAGSGVGSASSGAAGNAPTASAAAAVPAKRSVASYIQSPFYRDKGKVFDSTTVSEDQLARLNADEVEAFVKPSDKNKVRQLQRSVTKIAGSCAFPELTAAVQKILLAGSTAAAATSAASGPALNTASTNVGGPMRGRSMSTGRTTGSALPPSYQYKVGGVTQTATPTPPMIETFSIMNGDLADAPSDDVLIHFCLAELNKLKAPARMRWKGARDTARKTAGWTTNDVRANDMTREELYNKVTSSASGAGVGAAGEARAMSSRPAFRSSFGEAPAGSAFASSSAAVRSSSANTRGTYNAGRSTHAPFGLTEEPLPTHAARGTTRMSEPAFGLPAAGRPPTMSSLESQFNELDKWRSGAQATGSTNIAGLSPDPRVSDFAQFEEEFKMMSKEVPVPGNRAYDNLLKEFDQYIVNMQKKFGDAAVTYAKSTRPRSPHDKALVDDTVNPFRTSGPRRTSTSVSFVAAADHAMSKKPGHCPLPFGEERPPRAPAGTSAKYDDLPIGGPSSRGTPSFADLSIDYGNVKAEQRRQQEAARRDASAEYKQYGLTPVDEPLSYEKYKARWKRTNGRDPTMSDEARMYTDYDKLVADYERYKEKLAQCKRTGRPATSAASFPQENFEIACSGLSAARPPTSTASRFARPPLGPSSTGLDEDKPVDPLGLPPPGQKMTLAQRREQAKKARLMKTRTERGLPPTFAGSSTPAFKENLETRWSSALPASNMNGNSIGANGMDTARRVDLSPALPHGRNTFQPNAAPVGQSSAFGQRGSAFGNVPRPVSSAFGPGRPSTAAFGMAALSPVAANSNDRLFDDFDQAERDCAAAAAPRDTRKSTAFFGIGANDRTAFGASPTPAGKPFDFDFLVSPAGKSLERPFPPRTPGRFSGATNIVDAQRAAPRVHNELSARGLPLRQPGGGVSTALDFGASPGAAFGGLSPLSPSLGRMSSLPTFGIGAPSGAGAQSFSRGSAIAGPKNNQTRMVGTRLPGASRPSVFNDFAATRSSVGPGRRSLGHVAKSSGGLFDDSLDALLRPAPGDSYLVSPCDKFRDADGREKPITAFGRPSLQHGFGGPLLSPIGAVSARTSDAFGGAAFGVGSSDPFSFDGKTGPALSPTPQMSNRYSSRLEAAGKELDAHRRRDPLRPNQPTATTTSSRFQRGADAFSGLDRQQPIGAANQFTVSSASSMHRPLAAASTPPGRGAFGKPPASSNDIGRGAALGPAGHAGPQQGTRNPFVSTRPTSYQQSNQQQLQKKTSGGLFGTALSCVKSIASMATGSKPAPTQQLQHHQHQPAIDSYVGGIGGLRQRSEGRDQQPQFGHTVGGFGSPDRFDLGRGAHGAHGAYGANGVGAQGPSYQMTPLDGRQSDHPAYRGAHQHQHHQYAQPQQNGTLLGRTANRFGQMLGLTAQRNQYRGGGIDTPADTRCPAPQHQNGQHGSHSGASQFSWKSLFGVSSSSSSSSHHHSAQGSSSVSFGAPRVQQGRGMGVAPTPGGARRPYENVGGRPQIGRPSSRLSQAVARPSTWVIGLVLLVPAMALYSYAMQAWAFIQIFLSIL